LTATTDMRPRLEDFFRQRSDDPDTVKVTDYQSIVGGYSRAMARFWVEDATGRRGYVVRSDPPAGQSILDTDRGQEWALLSVLHEAGTIPLPAPRWFDSTGEELGSPAIIMDMIEGDSVLTAARRAEDTSEFPAFAQRVSELAAAVHTLDIDCLPAHMDTPDSWDDYIEARIQRWVDAEQAHVSSDPLMRYIASWLRANKPPPAPFRLVHGDFQIANVLVDEDRSYFLVDWELGHIGDPREDLGWSVLAAVLQPPDVVAGNEEAFYARYRELTGLTEEQVNPRTVAFFTVLASDSVFISVTEQLAAVARGETTSITVAYMSNAVVGMHDVFMKAMDLHDGGGAE
jgi:aminoglycoside phosphotransferase (APT) family kinase protein